MTYFVDDLGEPVPLSGPASRVVSLVPSLTEAVEVSAPGRLAGATDYCTHPSTLDVPRVGGSKYPKLDRVLDLAPDLVLANAEENRPEDVERLRANGIPVWVMAAAASVPAALGSLRRILTQAYELDEPDWLVAAEEIWREVRPVRFHAVVPVWRKPWIVLGRDTFAGDVLRRVGVANVYATAGERYPRPDVEELRAHLSTDADLLVLPDEPYLFTEEDGPDHFPDARYVLVSGRHLTWYGPSLVEAHAALTASIPSGP
ncbi:ABC transporter substrate-binding protein [Amycolatopsis mediterranei S699]|uniref:ABC transport system substrate-binding protein n=2 Tax=Amycolatopsis mediterranei TaxID=33910 RepID=A0A0H3CYK0_AMYMU|nr:helical backbone metal receptor [Amycolatopsis mediterranei]ADJ43009.1 ABC transport system substrate-binding protein [Amycolatopsis mediterranei U32]AEK39704.1 ABC transporter substrate-binding protein [Amycolatopsis mediterranei S699]AFO74724.1 ABC transporter substrate-binding protein [Amycolatopsis mediterranei S699]AGT81853.1 ABC transporter substrate-binding protein [Amycolatopsis mediterranei RB]KDO04324.1 ABC transporter substrate-binding protein [Amycolatopsis mediterranei]